MDYLPVTCLLLILANFLAPLECAGSTSIAPPCKKDGSEGQHCYRTALCQTCLQTEIRCYEEDDLSALKAIRFKDAFCGHHGVVLVDKKSNRVQTLLPLECSNGICPDQSECRTNPEDGISYCCSLEKLVNSQCFTLDVAGRSKEAVTRKITDENGNPVNISKVTILLENSDVKCLHGWSYSFKEDTVFMTNQCPVRFEICYESRPPILISPNATDPTIMCQPIELKCRTNEHKTKKILDRNKQPVTILSVTITKQLTRVKCEQDKNFFFNGSNISVKNGCGAKFKICYHVLVPDVSTTLPSTQRPRVDTEIRSEQGACVFIELSSAPDRLDQKKSVDAKGLPLQVRSMDVYERYSEAKCLSGQTYGFTGSLVQASGGCRATFKVCYYGIQVTTPASPLRAESGACVTVELSSSRDVPAGKTSVDSEGSPLEVASMDVQHEYSNGKCLSGVTYSFTGSTIEATGACWASFKVCYKDAQITTRAIPIIAEPGACVLVKLSSTPASLTEKESIDVQGTPLEVRNMDLQHEFSSEKCLTGETYGFNGSVVQASGGCNATFNVCYQGSLATLVIGERGACRLVQLSSTSDSPAEKKSIDVEGSPLEVESMQLHQEYSSNTKCLPGKTFYFDGSTVKATAGCRASLIVCYRNRNIGTPAPLSTVTSKVSTMAIPTKVSQEVTPTATTETACKIVEFVSGFDTERTLKDSQGRPVAVISMGLIDLFPSECHLGETFTFSGSVVRVTGRCRGQFWVCYLTNTSQQVAITPAVPVYAEPGACVLVELSSTPASLTEKESVDAQGTPLEVRNMDLQHEYSYEKCLTGETFGFNGSVIRASGGCKATFNVCYLGSLATLVIGERGACRLVQLSSTSDSPAEKKSIDVEGSPLEVESMQLHQEYSKDKCLPGETFNYEGNTVKATAGCRASLIVCYRNRDIGTPAPLSTVSSKVGTTGIPIKGLHTACETVDLSSETNGVAEKSFEDSQGRPLFLTSIVAVNTLFSPKCLPGKTYTISGSVVRVTGGCKGRFLVCYLMNTSPHVATTATVPVTVSQEITTTATTETVSQEVTTTATTETVSQEVTTTATTETVSQEVTTTAITQTDCKFVTLVSDSDTEKTIQDAQGRPVTVVSMRDIDWSPQWCDAGKTFTFSGSVVRVTGRCRGHFLVCYLKNTSPQVATTPTVPVNVSQEVTTTATTETVSQEVTTTATTETACKIVEFVSDFDTKRTLKDSQGRPVAVISMGLIDLFPSECHLGETFTFSGSVVRVTGRCRGKFWVCYLTNTSQQVATTPAVPVYEAICQKVTLRGRNGDPEIYSLTANNNNTLQVVSMDLVQPLSFVKCDQWLNYYFEGSAVLSKRGCWGEFEVCYLENVATLPIVLNEPEGQSCRSITLSSIGERESQRVITDLTGKEVTVRSVRLTRQLSQTPCVLGSTFRFEGSHVVSSRGCIGIFQICFDKRDVNVTAPAGEICDQEVTLFSYISDPDIYKLKVNGHTVTIRSVTLVRQISEIDCVSGDSYFFTESTLTARDGCRGVFRVCYVTRGGNNVSPTLEVVTTGLQVTTTQETPTQETPTQEIPTQEPTTQETPTQETPTLETSTQETSTQETPTQETPTQETPTQETPTPETWTQETSTTETSTQETPTQETSTQKTPTQETPTQETLNQETSTQVFTTQEMSTQVTTTPDARTSVFVNASMLMRTRVMLKCENITLISHSLPVTKDFVDSGGNPLPIVSVEVVKNFSKRRCVVERSFYVEQNSLQLFGNCRAVFRVCVDAGDGDLTTPTATTETDQNCENVKLMSTQKLPVKKTFIDSDGNQLPIISATLVEQISRTKCAVDDTFSVYEYALSVFGGCKAVFRVCVGSADGDMTTSSTTTESKPKCENVKLMSTLKKPVKKTFIDSDGNQLPIISVTLVEQISKTECVEDNTFSVYEHALRVFGGCKAVFQICVDAAVVEMTTLATPEGEECMKLEMDSGKSKKIKQIKIVDRTSKRPVRITSVDVNEQMSDVPCEPGETFVYEDNSVRVTGGCGAMFNICYEKEKLASPKKECTEVTLRSLQHKAKAATIKDKKHNPVRIVSVEVLTQLSHIPCILWETFNYKASLLWAGGGCSAVFKVCYEKSPV